MSEKCGQCNKNFEDNKNKIKCMGACEKYYHAECTGIRAPDTISKFGSKSTWRCSACKMTLQSGSAIGITEDIIGNMLQDLKTDILKRLETELNSFRESINFFSAKFDEFSSNVSEMKEEFKNQKKQMDALREENKNLWSEVGYLRDQINELQQYSRSTNLEISGITETQGENITTVVEAIAKTIGVERQPGDILIAHRVPTKSTRRPKPIIVQLRSKTDRVNWIAAFRKKRNLTCRDLHPNLPQERFYVNEHLTSYNKDLLFKSKRFAKDHGYDFCWVTNGKVFLRKKSATTAIRVFSPGDIQRLEEKMKKEGTKQGESEGHN